MGYKLLEISALYSKYLDSFYEKNSFLNEYSYNEHLKKLMDDCFAECDFIHYELRKLGVDSQIVVFNDEKLQRKWKSEFKDKSLFEIVTEQIKKINPDVLYVSDMSIFSASELKYLRTFTKNNCKYVGWHFSQVPYYADVLAQYDQIYTGSKFLQNQISKYVKDIRLLYHAFNEKLLSVLPNVPKENSLVFPGSIIIGEEFHNGRVDLIGKLKKYEIPCSYYGSLYGSFMPKNLRQAIGMIYRHKVPSLFYIRTEKMIKENIHAPVFGLEYYKVINNYTVCVNQHAKIAGTGAGNMRMFEATGLGVCLLTDARDENSDLFDIANEIVTYNSYDELIEKAKWLLENPKEAEKIAKNGQSRTLRCYSYRNKAEKMNSFIKEIL